MTVDPGFGGQEYIPGMTAKIAAVRKMIDARNLKTDLEVDGGINAGTAPAAVAAGARALVAGSAIYHAPDCVAAIQHLRQSVRDL
jgi:ribulose-phosphate 3-epimerase